MANAKENEKLHKTRNTKKKPTPVHNSKENITQAQGTNGENKGPKKTARNQNQP
ncbi:hypothetical protein [Bacteroides graminisolvens]|uniref:hypothetical protein n=1 Tax=Bacteroides graminisolvens TaxID=477666 RepID=UPI000421A251|nr:hypothetical protein [Bacteroides graminisolvens]